MADGRKAVAWNRDRRTLRNIGTSSFDNREPKEVEEVGGDIVGEGGRGLFQGFRVAILYY